MQASVVRAWTKFIRQYEGYCTWIYLDTHEPPLPTTGIGNLMGSNTALSAFGLSLPFRRLSNGTLGPYATEADITAEFKRLRDADIKGSGYAFKEYATLFLDDSVIEFIVGAKLLTNERTLLKTFPKFSDWPANAQLAVSNMAWLMGPSFAEKNKWPNFTKAINSGDFTGAAYLCKDKDGWDKERNRVNRDNLLWAGIVASNGMDASILRTAAPVPPVAHRYDGYVSLSAVKQALAGTVNPDGKYVQDGLHQAGLYKSAIDGKLGPVTKAALAKFCDSVKADINSVTSWLYPLMTLINYEVRD